MTWQNIKIKNLLTHSSGLPDYIRYDLSIPDQELFSKLYKDEIHFEAGSRYEYNQTNYWLLTLIIEKVTGQKYEEFILKNQFTKPFKNVLFSANTKEAIPNRIVDYIYNKKSRTYEVSTFNYMPRGYSAGGFNISLGEFIKWNKKLDKNMLIKEETKKQMLKPFIGINSNPITYNYLKDNFLYGWESYKINKYNSYGFTGGGVSGFRKFFKNNLTIIFLSNGNKNEPVIYKSINYIAGIIDEDLIEKSKILNEDVRLTFMLNNIKKAGEHYYKIKTEHIKTNFGETLNWLGYYYISERRAEDAIKLFEMNVKENPNSSNAYDSLGEGFFINKQYDLALKNYKKSLHLDSKNSSAQKMIKLIKKLLTEKN